MNTVKSDGQLYSVRHKGEAITPPDNEPIRLPVPPKRNFGFSLRFDDLLIVGIIIILLSDRCETDIPLVLALAYVLLIN